MSPSHRWPDEPDDELEDEPYAEDSDSGDPGPGTMRCPECKAEVYDDAVQCPNCGNYITADTSPWSGRSLWWIVLGLLGAVAAVAALAGLTGR